MKNMKKALSLFLALSMLLTVCAVNVLADDTVTLTVPNGNFANTTSAENAPLTDGWTAKTVGTTTDWTTKGTLQFLSTQNNPVGEGDKTGALEMIYRSNGAGNYQPAAESPKIFVNDSKEPLTEMKQFTLSADYQSAQITFAGWIAIHFYNAEGKLYNGGQWIDELQSGNSRDSWKLKDAVGQNCYFERSPSPTAWENISVTAVAPVGTVSVAAVLSGVWNGTGRLRYDNVGISYKSLPTGPQQVEELVGIPGDSQITLNWKLPAILNNYAGVKIDVKNTETIIDTVYVEDSAATSKVIDGLTNGTEYTFEVSSMNADKSQYSVAAVIRAMPEGKPVSSGGVFTIPNADFEQTVTANSADIAKYGWEVTVYPSDKTLVAGQNCYEISNLHKSSGEGFPEMAPNTPDTQTANNTLRIKQTSGSTYGSFLMQNKLPLAEAFTTNQKVTFQFDYAYRLTPPIFVTMLFYNEEGKVWNGAAESWETLEVTGHSVWQCKDAVGRDSYAVITPGEEGVVEQKVWGTYSFSSIAPAGTAAVSIGFTSIASGAGITYIDNLKGFWTDAPEYVWATVSSGENGSISPSGKIGVVKGETETFQIRTADTSYILNQVKYNGVPVEVTGKETATDKDGKPVYYYYNYTTPAMNADATIDVSFTLAEEQEKIMSASSTFTGMESGISYGLAFATVSLGATLGEYGILFSETELDGESFVIGAEGVFDGKAVTAANAKGQYGIKLAGSLISGKTYYTRAYAKYGENYIYSDRIITVVIP